jgi:hypothetical protein
MFGYFMKRDFVAYKCSVRNLIRKVSHWIEPEK